MCNSQDDDPTGTGSASLPLAIDFGANTTTKIVSQDVTHGAGDSLVSKVQAFIDHWKDADYFATPLYPYCDSDEVKSLLSHAQHLQKNRDYPAAFSAYGKALSLQILQCNLDALPVEGRPGLTRTIGHIISLLFEQFPDLFQSDQAAKSLVSFTKLSVQEMDDLDTLIALLAVADWLVAFSHSEPYETGSLYNCTYWHDPIMEKTIGPDHITTLRLIYHWGRMIARGSVSRIHDSARAKELYQRALAGFSKHLGSHDPETIDCTHDLGTLYLTQAEPNYTLAEALFLCLYTSQREELGMDDDRTLRSLAALARTYRLQGKNAQAGKLIWIGPEYGLRVLEDFFFELNGLGSMKYWKFPRGKRDYMNEIWELSSFGAPDDYCWQNKALLCLPIQQVHFTTALPSDLEKFNYWHHIGHMESNHEPSGLHHMCEIVEDTHIDLVVPYIPYSHFLQSNDFTSGFLYKSYVLPWIGLGWLDFGETCVSDKLTERKNTSSKYVMVNSESSSTCITGFFNGIPGDTAIISNYDNDTHTSFNFVSSNWVDYKQFTLHTTTEEMTPKLTTADGSTITCHGYISGTWTDFNAKSTWNGLMVFVVDAVFYFPESSTVDHHFLFCSDSLEPDRQYFMTPEETRSFCASLNPTLLSPLKISRVEWCGIFHKECRVNVKGPSQVDMLFWEEMSRREAWDREFENNIPELPEDKSRMEQLKEEETHLRQEWDLKFRQPPTMQQNVTSSVANGAAQSHKPLSRAAILGKLRR